MTQLPSGHLSRRQALRLLGGVTAAALVPPVLSGCATTPKSNASGPTAKSGSASAGSSGSAPAKAGTGTLTVYFNSGHVYQSYQKVFDAFTAKTGVKVAVQKFQWPDLLTKLTADFLSGDVPDLVEEPGTFWPTQYGMAGNIRSLDDYIAKDGASMGFPSDWQPLSLGPRQYNGKTFGVPLHLTCGGLIFYNKGMFDKAGIKAPPTTWDEFVSVAKDLSGNGVYGAALNSDYSYSPIWFMQNNVNEYDPASKQFFQPNDAMVEALQFQQDLIKKYKVAPTPVATTDYEGPQKLFSAKRAAMIFSGPWDILPIQKGSPDIEFGIAPPLKHTKQSTYMAGSGLMIPAKAKNPDQAWELIKQLTSLDVELQVTAEAKQTMPRKSWANSQNVQSNPLLAPIAASLPVAGSPEASLFTTGKASGVDLAYKTMYEQIVLQGADVSKSLATFRAAASKLMQS